MATIFISYSHRDEDLRKELETALSALRRQGLIEVWHDRRIEPGADFAAEIDQNLEAADIVLLLVSSYFIASDYAYGIEVARAMERHERGKARVIPIILRPTDWHGLPFGRLLALPPDGKPVTQYPDLHEAMLEISKGLRKVLEVLRQAEPARSAAAPRPEHVVPDIPARSERSEAGGPRSSNLRVKREFTDRERDEFLDETFEYLARFFENSLKELKHRNAGLDFRFRRIDANRFTAAVYAGGSAVSQCTIWRGSRSSFANGIAYTHGETDGANSYNELLSIADDGYSLFLQALGMSFRGRDGEDALTPQGASEFLWGIVIGGLQ